LWTVAGKALITSSRKAAAQAADCWQDGHVDPVAAVYGNKEVFAGLFIGHLRQILDVHMQKKPRPYARQNVQTHQVVGANLNA